MSKTASKWSDTVEIICTDNNKTSTGEILEFKPTKSITVSINRQVKLSLYYVDNKKLYVGNMAGMEFTTYGPKEIVTYKGRG